MWLWCAATLIRCRSTWSAPEEVGRPRWGRAAQGAARIVRHKLLAVVAALLEANPDDLEINDGVVTVRGSPDRCKTVAEVARLSYMAPFTLDEALGAGFDASFDFETPAGGWTQSTHVCWVGAGPRHRGW